jgi:hypothetical protein
MHLTSGQGFNYTPWSEASELVARPALDVEGIGLVTLLVSVIIALCLWIGRRQCTCRCCCAEVGQAIVMSPL